MVNVGCDSLTPRKACLGTTNIVLCILAAIFMISACASFGSGNTSNVPWFTQSKNFIVKTSNAQTESTSYYGLAGTVTCTTYTNDETAVTNANANAADANKIKLGEVFCTGMNIANKDTYLKNQPGTCGGDCVMTYSDAYNLDYTLTSVGDPKEGPNSCANTVNDWKSQTGGPCYPTNDKSGGPLPKNCSPPGECFNRATCYYGGGLTFGLALSGLIFALFTFICFVWRKNGDGCCAKSLTFFFSFVTCAVALASFLTMGPCAQYSSMEVTYEMATAPTSGYSTYDWSFGSGAGAVMSLMGFIVFLYVMIMNVLIKVDEADAAAAASNTGLDAKV